MVTTKNFFVQMRQRYGLIGGFLKKEWVPIDDVGNMTTDSVCADARREFDLRLNQAEEKLGRLIQLIDYEFFDGGVPNRNDVDRNSHLVTIKATGVFQKSD